jgi:hypothetical protein
MIKVFALTEQLMSFVECPIVYYGNNGTQDEDTLHSRKLKNICNVRENDVTYRHISQGFAADWTSVVTTSVCLRLKIVRSMFDSQRIYGELHDYVTRC